MSTRKPSYINPEPCQHLAEYKLNYGMMGYKSLQKCVKISPAGRSSVITSDTKIPRCCHCNGSQGRLYFCLICSSISCLDHTLFHSQTKAGNCIFVDVENAELYCCICVDQVYDPDFDKAVMAKNIMGFSVNKFENESIGERLSKRRRLGADAESKCLKLKLGVSSRDQRAKSCYPMGLRGLNNLGNTCFMNSVLQAFLHAPPLKNHFLSGGHHRDTCHKRSTDQFCLPCDMSLIFSAMYSGDRIPHSPAHFLYSWWQHSSNLANYEQQDAHEFFISVLDGIHEKESKAKNQNGELQVDIEIGMRQKESGNLCLCHSYIYTIISTDIRDCHCVAHKTFSGLLRSDVTCLNCGFTSTTHDPCLDISLDLQTPGFSSAEVAKKSLKLNENCSISTLLGCLDLFTRVEKLGSNQKLFCENCREMQDSLKQMSIRRLPLVLCLHIKRFEHSWTKRMCRKIDQYVQFPFSLDMSPYLSSSIIRSRFGNRISAYEGDETDSPSEFEIFAVVTHTGKLESGHYISYLRLRNQWYKCDDAWITEADDATVRASECYMIFYVQKRLYLKASEDFNCLPLSPARDKLLPIAGCC